MARTNEVTCHRERPLRCGVVVVREPEEIATSASPWQHVSCERNGPSGLATSTCPSPLFFSAKPPASPSSSNINGCPALFCISTPSRIKRCTRHWLAPAIEEPISPCKACVRRLFAASTTYGNSTPTSPLHSCPTPRDRTFQRPAFPLPSRPAWPSLLHQVSSLPDLASRGPVDRYTRPVEPR